LISVIIPALNEELTVGDVVRGVRGALATGARDTEVIVVDGGSTDATARQAELAGARLISKPGAGKGTCVREGISAARGDTLVLLDSDGQDVPAELASLIRAFRASRSDFVSGPAFWRMRSGTAILPTSWSRKPYSRLGSSSSSGASVLVSSQA